MLTEVGSQAAAANTIGTLLWIFVISLLPSLVASSVFNKILQYFVSARAGRLLEQLRGLCTHPASKFMLNACRYSAVTIAYSIYARHDLTLELATTLAIDHRGTFGAVNWLLDAATAVGADFDRVVLITIVTIIGSWMLEYLKDTDIPKEYKEEWDKVEKTRREDQSSQLIDRAVRAENTIKDLRKAASDNFRRWQATTATRDQDIRFAQELRQREAFRLEEMEERAKRAEADLAAAGVQIAQQGNLRNKVQRELASEKQVSTSRDAVLKALETRHQKLIETHRQTADELTYQKELCREKHVDGTLCDKFHVDKAVSETTVNALAKEKVDLEKKLETRTQAVQDGQDRPELQAKVTTMTAEIQNIKMTLVATQTELQQAGQALEATKKENSELTAEIKKLTTEARETKQPLLARPTEPKTADQAVQAAQATQATQAIQQENLDLKSTAASLTAELASTRKDLAQVQTELGKAGRTLQAVQQERADLKTEAENAVADLESKLQVQAGAAQGLPELQAMASNMSTELANVKNALADSQTELQQAGEALIGLQSANTNLTAHVEELTAEVATAKKELQDKQTDLSTAEKTLQVLQGEKPGLEAKVARLTADAAKIQEGKHGFEAKVMAEAQALEVQFETESRVMESPDFCDTVFDNPSVTREQIQLFDEVSGYLAEYTARKACINTMEKTIKLPNIQNCVLAMSAKLANQIIRASGRAAQVARSAELQHLRRRIDGLARTFDRLEQAAYFSTIMAKDAKHGEERKDQRVFWRKKHRSCNYNPLLNITAGTTEIFDRIVDYVAEWRGTVKMLNDKKEAHGYHYGALTKKEGRDEELLALRRIIWQIRQVSESSCIWKSREDIKKFLQSYVAQDLKPLKELVPNPEAEEKVIATARLGLCLMVQVRGYLQGLDNLVNEFAGDDSDSPSDFDMRPLNFLLEEKEYDDRVKRGI